MDAIYSRSMLFYWWWSRINEMNYILVNNTFNYNSDQTLCANLKLHSEHVILFCFSIDWWNMFAIWLHYPLGVVMNDPILSCYIMYQSPNMFIAMFPKGIVITTAAHLSPWSLQPLWNLPGSSDRVTGTWVSLDQQSNNRNMKLSLLIFARYILCENRNIIARAQKPL